MPGPTKRVQYNIDTSTSAVIPIEFRRQYGRFNGSSPAFYQQGRVESGTITVLPFNTTGLTKNVHLVSDPSSIFVKSTTLTFSIAQLTVDSIRYAAKQVKYDGTGTASRPKHISTKENLQYLEGELLTSACLASVVEHFTWVMKDVAPGIPIYRTFRRLGFPTVTDCDSYNLVSFRRRPNVDPQGGHGAC